MRRKLTSLTLDMERVVRWGEFSADANPLHTDPEFAATTPFGVPIVHGHLLACIALDAVQDAMPAAMTAGHRASVRFAAPVPVGATVDLLWDDSESVLTVQEPGTERSLVEIRIRPVVSASHVISRAVVDGYALAARDANSIHMSDEAARASGFEGAIAHGMLTLGWAVVQLMQHPDFRHLRTLQARFAAPVPVGDEIRLVMDESDANRAALRVLRGDGTVVLTVDATHGEGPDAVVLEFADDAEIVAEQVLRIDAADAARFAAALGSGDGFFTSAERARAAGFSSIPMPPTLAFAAPVLGFLADDPLNAGKPVPDPVADCQAWMHTDRPVVHAGQSFTFVRPIVAEERLHARTAVISRSERTSSSGQRLRFTGVRTIFRAEQGEIVAMSEMNLVVIGD